MGHPDDRASPSVVYFYRYFGIIKKLGQLLGSPESVVRMSNLERIDPTAIARFFSSTVIREMARRGKSPTFARLVRESGLLSCMVDSATVAELLDDAFRHLRRKQHRHEYIYKAAITKKVLLGTHSLQTASMLTEFRVGDCKADVVILNGTATVYEIKSERDTLSRLQKQLGSYRRVFARTNVIAGENHIGDILAMAPKEVGVLRLTDRYSIRVEREAADCTSETCSGAIFDAISLREAEAILVDNGVETPRVPNTQRHAVLRKAFLSLPAVTAHRGMVTALKRSRNLLPLHELIDSLPESLHTASLSTRLRKCDHERLITAVHTPLSGALQWA